jgi:alkylation response protein AidB-like acyl-CoA dehydrogenase
MTPFSNHDPEEALPDLENIASSTLKTSVAPLANEIDGNPKILQQALMSLGEKGLLALRIPRKWGGYAASDRSFFNYQQLVPRYSGALAFLEVQHQSAASTIASSENLQLQELYLPKLSQGKMLIGVGFSQIRRSGKPSVKAIPIAGGYQFKGFVPWVTGWGIFDEFILAGIMPGGRAIFAVVPFVKTVNPSSSIQFSEPMVLCGTSSTNTVTATVDNWLVPEERVVFIKPPGWIHENDKNNV